MAMRVGYSVRIIEFDVRPALPITSKYISCCIAPINRQIPPHSERQTTAPGHARHLVAQSTHRLDRIGLQCLEAAFPREERDHDLAQRVAQRLAQPVEARQHAVGRERRGGRLGGGEMVARRREGGGFDHDKGYARDGTCGPYLHS